jgi:hypothetical protein
MNPTFPRLSLIFASSETEVNHYRLWYDSDMSLAVLIALVVGPVLLLYLLRVNAAFVYLSLCLGDVLVQFSGDDAASIVAGASTTANLTTSTIKLALLVAPAILTVLFMMGTAKGQKRLLNVLPSAAAGLLLALLAVPLLPPGLGNSVTALPVWVNTSQLQSGIIAGSTLVCLLFLWMSRPKHGGEKHKGKHH